MLSLRIQVLDERAARPVGNPFEMRSVGILYRNGACFCVRTGLAIVLPTDTTLEIRSSVDGLFITGWRMDDELQVMMRFTDDAAAQLVVDGQPFALAYLVERKTVPVRFIEFRDKARVVVGGAEKVKKDG